MWHGHSVPERSIEQPTGRFQGPLWRAIAVFRFASLGYVFALVLINLDEYAEPAAAVPVLVSMTAWTIFASYAYARPARRRWPLLVADLLLVMAALLASVWVVGQSALGAGVPTLAVAWQGGPVLAWAVTGGRLRGAVAALILGGTDLLMREQVIQPTVNGVILMLLAGIAVGHVARLSTIAEERLQRATELEAATRERERLARGIHDSVLQVLALVQRRGARLDGEAGELARLAGEQEAALRALIAIRPPTAADGQEADLRTVLGGYASATVSVAMPATPVRLPGYAAREIGAATGAALDNAVQHGGGRAWVLVEEEAGVVTVSIRDDGPGMPVGRLAEAAERGRLGVAQSIQGRIAELGGTVRITTAPGQGTEVELRVPLR
jgi:signal transduction histidine kinase